jgi:hypothetical protein
MADETIPIRRATVPIPDFVTRAQSDASQKQEVKYPSEIIPLPTKGWFYPESSPLASGEIELKQMTAKEEDILANQELIRKGKVLEKLLDSLIINKLIKQEEILVPDKNGIFIAIRRLAYGDDYPVNITCPTCGAVNRVIIKLNELENKPFDFNSYPKGENRFTYELPNSKVTITYKLLNQLDEQSIEAEADSLRKISKDNPKDVTTKLKYVITSVGGNVDKNVIRRFVDEQMMAKDSLALRKHFKETNPDVDRTFDYKCSNFRCNFERRMDMPIEASFLWPDLDPGR